MIWAKLRVGYLVVVFFYTLLVPIQELIARCALQSTFFSFLPGNETFRIWNAIILSNLIFSSVHSHLSLMFASLTFVPGLFWGWLFYKQASLVSVSASHILIGVWGIFILGAKGVIYWWNCPNFIPYFNICPLLILFYKMYQICILSWRIYAHIVSLLI